jgi:transcriptional regulator with XRE-family HTH domain
LSTDTSAWSSLDNQARDDHTQAVPLPSGQTFGALLREWRQRRRMSQLDLACDADISTKHLSFLETGRSRPSRQMVLHLAACLDVPLRDRNVMLSAAGFAPMFQERSFNEPGLDLVRRNVEIVLAAHDPYPALAVDRHWRMLAANRAVAHLLAGAEPSLLRPPVNVLRLSLHPAGLASRIVNLTQWRAHVIARLRRQIDLTGDAVLTDLLEELRDYPGSRGIGSPAPEDESGMIAIPFRLATIDGVVSFFSTTTLFGTPIDITVSELAIEAFLPADTETAEIMRRLAQQREAHQDARGASPERSRGTRVAS